jgi:hypothetical protein
VYAYLPSAVDVLALGLCQIVQAGRVGMLRKVIKLPTTIFIVRHSDFSRNHFLLAEIGEPICLPQDSSRAQSHHVLAWVERRMPSPLFDAPFGKTIVPCQKNCRKSTRLVRGGDVATGLMNKPHPHPHALAVRGDKNNGR